MPLECRMAGHPPLRYLHRVHQDVKAPNASGLLETINMDLTP